MARLEDHIGMITAVASAMGQALCNEVAFVGGCTTALLLTDGYATTQVRHTDDVDLIVHVISKPGWYALVDMLREKGFKETMQQDGAPICAMKLGHLRVDFMPDDANILGFSNRWYKDAYAKATPYRLNEQLTIRVTSPEYFLATKLEAYEQRGNNNPLYSQDIEDILTLVDGRAELLTELITAPAPLRSYISEKLGFLLKHSDFDDAIQTAAIADSARVGEIYRRIELIISYAQLA